MTITAKWTPDGTTAFDEIDPETYPGYVELALEDGVWELDSSALNERILGGSYNASAFTEAIPGFVSLDDADVTIQTLWEAACASQLVRFSLAVEGEPITFFVGDDEVKVPLEVARSRDFDEENL